MDMKLGLHLTPTLAYLQKKRTQIKSGNCDFWHYLHTFVHTICIHCYFLQEAFGLYNLFKNTQQRTVSPNLLEGVAFFCVRPFHREIHCKWSIDSVQINSKYIHSRTSLNYENHQWSIRLPIEQQLHLLQRSGQRGFSQSCNPIMTV